MNENERERSMPIFLFFSMVLHALLFLYGPQIVAGLIPGFQPGDQGGLTYVTLIDVAPIERPRAMVSDSARVPESRPEPRPRPEPVQAPTTPEPARVEVPAPPAAQTVSARPAVTPDPVRTEVAPPARTPAATPIQVNEERPVAPEPVMTSDRGVDTIPTTGEQPQIEAPPAEDVSTPSTEPIQAPIEIEENEPVVDASTEQTVEGGTGATQDVPSAAPGADISDETSLPPMGTSMANAQGGFTYPKQAVDFLRRTVTVQLAAFISAQGEVVQVNVIDSSGIEPVDAHAMDIARYGITYKPYDSDYELRIFVTYNHEERRLSYRVGEFFQAAPLAGSFVF